MYWLHEVLQTRVGCLLLKPRDQASRGVTTLIPCSPPDLTLQVIWASVWKSVRSHFNVPRLYFHIWWLSNKTVFSWLLPLVHICKLSLYLLACCVCLFVVSVNDSHNKQTHWVMNASCSEFIDHVVLCLVTLSDLSDFLWEMEREIIISFQWGKV